MPPTIDDDCDRAADRAHEALWRAFIGPEGLIRDFAGEIPSPEDCALGRPNALGWWSPIENGPMFTGTYLPAMCERARRSESPGDRAKARVLSQGLLHAASVSDVPGFIARGFATDGRSHYPLGSQDQTHPWFYGLHAYLSSGLPDRDERNAIVAKMVEVATALDQLDWKCPCDGVFTGQSRGNFAEFRHHGAAMFLFILRAMHAITGEQAWLDRYHRAIREQSPLDGRTRVQICAEGYRYDERQNLIPDAGKRLLWIYVSSQGGMAWLARTETDPVLRSAFLAGLEANAAGSLTQIPLFEGFDTTASLVFGNADWRAGYGPWFAQETQQDAEQMAWRAIPGILGNGKTYEAERMRHPLAAAAIAALGGRDGDGLVRRALCHYDYARLHMAEFFFAECAYFASPTLGRLR